MNSPADPSGQADPVRDRIHSAVVAEVVSTGFDRATVAGACARAGVSRGDFERRFDDLEDCFCEVFDPMAEGFVARMAGVYLSETSWRDGIRAVAYAFIAYLREDPDRARFSMIESLSAGERANLIRDRVFAALFALIDLGRQEMADPGSLSPTTAEAVGGAVFNQIRAEVERGNFDGLPDIVPTLMYTVVLPYLGTGAAHEELNRATGAG